MTERVARRRLWAPKPRLTSRPMRRWLRGSFTSSSRAGRRGCRPCTSRPRWPLRVSARREPEMDAPGPSLRPRVGAGRPFHWVYPRSYGRVWSRLPAPTRAGLGPLTRASSLRRGGRGGWGLGGYGRARSRAARGRNKRRGRAPLREGGWTGAGRGWAAGAARLGGPPVGRAGAPALPPPRRAPSRRPRRRRRRPGRGPRSRPRMDVQGGAQSGRPRPAASRAGPRRTRADATQPPAPRRAPPRPPPAAPGPVWDGRGESRARRARRRRLRSRRRPRAPTAAPARTSRGPQGGSAEPGGGATTPSEAPQVASGRSVGAASLRRAGGRRASRGTRRGPWGLESPAPASPRASDAG